MNASQAHPTAPAFPVTPPSQLSAPLRLRVILVGLGLLGLALSVVSRWLRPDQADLLSLWSMFGLAVAAVPVIWDSLTSLKSDGFEATKYYMDQFVALAILACFATGQYATGTFVATILILGQMLEEHTTLGVEEAVASLLRLSQVRARRLDATGETAVAAADLRSGDRVRVLAGDLVPADGEVVAGSSTLDQASITGESLPVEARVGTRVFAGTVNQSGAIELVVGQSGSGTVLGRVTSIVEEAKASRAPVMRLIDDYTRFYMPFVLIVAGFVLFFSRDIGRAIAVIIVAMPCAFVLASPTAMVAALAVASRLGVLVKSSRHFESAVAVDTVVFDKTGTLTTGALRVTAVLPAPGGSEEDLLRAAGRLEAHSSHPVAKAVQAEVARRGIELGGGEVLGEEVPGCGLRGNGLLAGRRAWLCAQGIAIPDTNLEDAPFSSLHVAQEGRYAGALLLADTLRPEAVDAIEELKRVGVVDFVMLTGDRPAVAARIAAAAGITRFRADCLPEEKLAEVRALKEAGRRVLVVGDGINDAPALAAGDLSVAMGALGSDVAIKTADVALMGSDLRHLARFLRISERTLAIIDQNLLWGLAFIVGFVVLSALGLISPILAAVLHEFSAFFVIFNSARLLRIDEQAAAP